MTRLAHAAALASIFSLGACGSGPSNTTAEGPPAPNVATQSTQEAPVANEVASAVPAVFTACAVCHTATKDGPNRMGPNLWGVFDTAAASKVGFAYSPALKAAGLTWDSATLDKWLTNPAALVPGTHMAFPGQPDASKRQELIAFLQSLK